MIRELKAEMEKMGLSDAVAMAIVQQEAAAAAAATAVTAAAAAAVALERTAGSEQPGASILQEEEAVPADVEPVGTDGAAARQEDSGGNTFRDLSAGCLSGGLPAEEEDWELNFDALGLGRAPVDDDSGDPTRARPLLPSPAAAAIVPTPAAGGDDDEDGWAGGLDLFADDGGGLADLASMSSAKPPQRAGGLEGPLLPYGAVGGGGKVGGGKKKGGAAAAAVAPREERQPLALLSQHCLKAGWSQPRFTKLTPQGGGGGGGGEGSLRYSATIDMGPARWVVSGVGPNVGQGLGRVMRSQHCASFPRTVHLSLSLASCTGAGAVHAHANLPFLPPPLPVDAGELTRRRVCLAFTRTPRPSKSRVPPTAPPPQPRCDALTVFAVSPPLQDVHLADVVSPLSLPPPTLQEVGNTSHGCLPLHGLSLLRPPLFRVLPPICPVPLTDVAPPPPPP